MGADAVVEVAGETLWLLGGRAVYRPSRGQLLIADLHLGKGDVLHGPAHDTTWRRDFDAWREAYAGIEVGALAGNHDRALPGANLAITLHGPGIDDVPFALRHDCDLVPGLHVLCGHLHPVVSLPGIVRRRWPVFWLRPDVTVLPAFSAFTGGFRVDPRVGERVGVCVDDGVVLMDGAAFEPTPRRFGRRR